MHDQKTSTSSSVKKAAEELRGALTNAVRMRNHTGQSTVANRKTNYLFQTLEPTTTLKESASDQNFESLQQQLKHMHTKMEFFSSNTKQF